MDFEAYHLITDLTFATYMIVRIMLENCEYYRTAENGNKYRLCDFSVTILNAGFWL